MEHLLDFKLDPPRGRQHRVALVLISKADQDGFHVEKLEHVEPTDESNAIACFRKLRTLSMGVRPDPTQKRSRALADSFKGSPNDMKRCKKLHAVPSDESLNGATFERKKMPFT